MNADTLTTVECPGCHGFGTLDDDSSCPLCNGTGWALVDDSPIPADILAAIDADDTDPGPMDPTPDTVPVDPDSIDPADLTANVDGTYTLAPDAPAPRPRIASDRYTLGGTVDRDNADRVALVDSDLIPDRWALLNANSGRMVTVVGVVIWLGTERRDGIDYGSAVVDTGSALVYVRARSDRLAPLGFRFSFRCELVDVLDPGSIASMSDFDRSALVLGSRGVRSPKLALDTDSNGIG